MKRGYVPIWVAVFSTLVVIALAGALWLGHQNYAVLIAPLAVVAWTWWSAILGIRERRNVATNRR
jgi:hypothetical protein